MRLCQQTRLHFGSQPSFTVMANARDWSYRNAFFTIGYQPAWVELTRGCVAAPLNRDDGILRHCKGSPLAPSIRPVVPV
jgi:hypothetical protein